MADIREEALDHWPLIHEKAGISPKLLDGRHHPCPVCGGKDRFRYINKEGTGSHFCSGCGAGDGMNLLVKYLGGPFRDAAAFARQVLLNTPTEEFHREVPKALQPELDEESIRNSLQKTAERCCQVTPGDPVWTYLRDDRMFDIAEVPKALRFHPSLGYYELQDGKSVRTGSYPAMVAIVRAPDGRPVSLHRTYLTAKGTKAPVQCVKKLMKGFGASGGAIRLYKAGKVLAVAEGIETAIAVHLLYGYPVWSVISSTLMKSFVPPPGVEEVLIFADNDLPDQRGRRAGQEDAESLRVRLVNEGFRVSVATPHKAGTDFADVWVEVVKRRRAERLIAA